MEGRERQALGDPLDAPAPLGKKRQRDQAGHDSRRVSLTGELPGNVKYSSTGGMNKALALSLEFYKLHDRLPSAHECHHISQRALELLAIGEPGVRHYVTGPQICSQFNNVSRDLTQLEKRLDRKRGKLSSADKEDANGSNDAGGSSGEPLVIGKWAWDDERRRMLQQIQMAKRGLPVTEEFVANGDLGTAAVAIKALHGTQTMQAPTCDGNSQPLSITGPTAPTMTMIKEAVSQQTSQLKDTMDDMLYTLKRLKKSMENIESALAAQPK